MSHDSDDIHGKAARTLAISSVEYQLGYKEALNAALKVAAADGLDLEAQSPAFAALWELALRNWATPVPPGTDFSGAPAGEN
ncbi:MAG: hypothetical protein JWM59_4496 [Verrucomicrobiales bacterium]|nr:hypothetical protein [Verrucomicrobiales bacterium]